MVLASAIVAGITLMAKTLGQGMGAEPLHPMQISAGRFCFAFLCVVPAVFYCRPSFRDAPWPLHVGRSITGWAAVSCLFAAAAVLPLANATAISFAYPLIAMLFAIPILRERVGKWRWGAATIGLVGATIVIGPGTDAFQPAALIAAAAACFMALEAVLLKKLSGKEPPLRILAINNGIGAFISAIAASLVWVPPSPLQWALLAAIGATMVTAQICFIQAMKSADASFVMPFFFATLVFAGIYDVIIFGDLPTLGGVLGAVLVVTGAVILAWRERRNMATQTTT